MSTLTAARPQTSGLAVASLTLAILSVVLGPFGCIPAIVCGHMARGKIRRDPSLCGDGLAVAGLIVGYVILALSLVTLAVFVSSAMLAEVRLGPTLEGH